jgi:tRNA (cmo5U34)-methyltransferase
MKQVASRKSTVEEIRERFDNDVERFSNLETGQAAQIDNPVMLDLVTAAAARVNPMARDVLDIGCGAGNFSVKLCQRIHNANFTLVDLSRPMLDRALDRVGKATAGHVTVIQSDIRETPLADSAFDIVMAVSVLHHLRTDEEWESVFHKINRALRPGGSFWISDFIEHDNPAVQALMWERYGEYLLAQGGPEYRDRVFGYVEKEDTPRSATYQIDLMKRVGFRGVDLLHKNACFASFGGIK